MNKLKLIWIVILLFVLICPSAYADNMALITRGLARTLFSVFEIPKDMIAYGGRAFPLGVVVGTVSGAVKTVTGTLMGVADIGRGAAPYAKYAIFAL